MIILEYGKLETGVGFFFFPPRGLHTHTAVSAAEWGRDGETPRWVRGMSSNCDLPWSINTFCRCVNAGSFSRRGEGEQEKECDFVREFIESVLL